MLRSMITDIWTIQTIMCQYVKSEQWSQIHERIPREMPWPLDCEDHVLTPNLQSHLPQSMKTSKNCFKTMKLRNSETIHTGASANLASRNCVPFLASIHFLTWVEASYQGRSDIHVHIRIIQILCTIGSEHLTQSWFWHSLLNTAYRCGLRQVTIRFWRISRRDGYLQLEWAVSVQWITYMNLKLRENNT